MSGSSNPSVARTVSPGAPSLEAAPSPRAEFDRARSDTSPQRDRPSNMVAEDQPKPAPRPSPSMADGADAAAFNARWQAEHDATKAAQVRATRKAAFIKARTSQAPSRAHTRNR